ncbi:hypothetical protein PIB30_085435 [Stylosanthes scabra]|uniref:Uncharacterized protein n=1 Tax=Stylosanthes scabra TaxID=79078 RepID=A0ABU6YUQ8_9FABA|nr:hypothetical protein [Stylosanthes scabra]
MWLGFDPMTHEATSAKKEMDAAKLGPVVVLDRLSSSRSADSCGSCPYPPGFGPCMGWDHVHHDLLRVQSLPQLERPLPDDAARAVVNLPCATPSLLVAFPGCHSHVQSDELCSGETLYHINDDEWFGEHIDHTELVGDDGGCGNGMGALSGDKGDDVHGEKTPYHTNEEVGCVKQSWGALCDFGAIPGGDAIGALGGVFSACGEGVGGPIGIVDAGFGSSDSLSVETLYRLNTEVLVGEQISVGGHGCDDLQNLSQFQIENPNDDGEDSIKEDSLLEAEAAKMVWGRGVYLLTVVMRRK